MNNSGQIPSARCFWRDSSKIGVDLSEQHTESNKNSTKSMETKHRSSFWAVEQPNRLINREAESKIDNYQSRDLWQIWTPAGLCPGCPCQHGELFIHGEAAWSVQSTNFLRIFGAIMADERWAWLERFHKHLWREWNTSQREDLWSLSCRSRRRRRTPTRNTNGQEEGRATAASTRGKEK
jgi:hypothetical protein